MDLDPREAQRKRGSQLLTAGDQLTQVLSVNRSKLTLFYLVASISFLVIGFSIGMAKLGEQDRFFSNSILGTYISVHPVLMVFGVIGGLLIAEKIEIMNKFLIFKRLPISYLIIVIMLPGILLLSIGYASEYAILRYTGSVLIAITGLLLTWFMVSLRNPGNFGVKLIMGSALVALSFSSIAESITSAIESPIVAFLLLSFPIIYILGERIELGQIRSIGKVTMGILVFSSIMIPVLLFFATLGHYMLIDRLLFDSSEIFLLILVLTSIRYDPTTRKLRSPGKLQSFMQFSIISSYAWLLVGIALYLVQMNVESGFMDPATHSIAIGFIGLFIIAHSPIIFPLTLKLKVDTTRVTKSPIYALNLAVFLRVGGDLISKQSEAGNVMAYSSVYVLMIAIFLFFFNIMRIKDKASAKKMATGNSG